MRTISASDEPVWSPVGLTPEQSPALREHGTHCAQRSFLHTEERPRHRRGAGGCAESEVGSASGRSPATIPACGILIQATHCISW